MRKMSHMILRRQIFVFLVELAIRTILAAARAGRVIHIPMRIPIRGATRGRKVRASTMSRATAATMVSLV